MFAHSDRDAGVAGGWSPGTVPSAPVQIPATQESAPLLHPQSTQLSSRQMRDTPGIPPSQRGEKWAGFTSPLLIIWVRRSFQSVTKMNAWAWEKRDPRCSKREVRVCVCEESRSAAHAPLGCRHTVGPAWRRNTQRDLLPALQTQGMEWRQKCLLCRGAGRGACGQGYHAEIL